MAKEKSSEYKTIKECPLTPYPNHKACRGIGNRDHYIAITEPVCKLQAVLYGSPFEISKMKECPVKKNPQFKGYVDGSKAQWSSNYEVAKK